MSIAAGTGDLDDAAIVNFKFGKSFGVVKICDVTREYLRSDSLNTRPAALPCYLDQTYFKIHVGFCGVS